MHRFVVAALLLVTTIVGTAIVGSPYVGPFVGKVSAQESKKVTAADMPRIPHTSPDKALSTFSLAAGFSLEIVAAEPLVSDPVDACFDEHGRMYVAEMHGYPFSQEPTKLYPSGGGKKDAGIIRLLEDTNGDGSYDKSLVFADKISWPTSVCCYDGGVFVLAPRFLYYFKDTTGDGRADVREVVLEGFGRGNVQALTNGLKWGLDNKIYFAGGRNGGEILHRGKKIFTVNGRDVRFDPRTEEFELVSGGLQFGHSMNDWGHRFVCSNSNHMQQVIFPQHYLARNPGLAAPSSVRSIAADGASARVFRASPPEPWRIIRQKWRAEAKGYKLVIENGAWKFLPLDPSKKAGVVPTEYPVGYFTSATGITIYRGGAYPEKFRGNAFVGDVGGNLVHRKNVSLNGIAYSAIRADEGEELIRSTDNWFRPVNFVNAPDGTLFALDMYRETVEHPYSIPAEIKAFLHLQSGADRGRVYRLLSPGAQPSSVPDLGAMKIAELVQQLESPNSWNRESAQRIIWERRDPKAAALLKELVAKSSSARARLHGLYALQGLDSLSAADLRPLVQHENARLREHVVRLSESFLDQHPKLLALVTSLADDEDARVRFQLALSLGESESPNAATALVGLAKSSGGDRDIRIAILSSAAGQAGALIGELTSDADFLALPYSRALISELAVSVGSIPNNGAALDLLVGIARQDVSPAVQETVLTAVGEGLKRRGTTLATLLEDKTTVPALRDRVAGIFQRAIEVANDEKQSLMTRATAVGLLAFADFSDTQSTLTSLLTPQTPQALQRAAVASLSQQDARQAGELLIVHWRGFSPTLRRDATDALLSSITRINLLLNAVERGRIKTRELDRDKIQVLLNHPSSEIKAASARVFAGTVTTDRAKVVASYQKVLALNADSKRGLQVFTKKCALCHRVGDIGHQVAPELASVQNKSPEDLLIAILDPNREAQPNYNTYTVITTDALIYNGIISSEGANSITIRKAEGKEDVVLRSNIDELIASGKSLMPEGLEKDLSEQDLADVIAFIKTIKPKTPAK